MTLGASLMEPQCSATMPSDWESWNLFPTVIFFFFITLFHIMFHGDFIQFDSSIQFFVVVVFLLSKAMVCYLAVAGIFLEFK